ncbi:uncharacterized protein LOC129730715 [Wyeomyia smithii]|uniref:uncharacterized protein LOC129730715 n=1 Tax=Wyeomyia smithii TaxID=174621 RepID=UPI002467EFAB|nr:uncharacterized protein LOC129730715 [Wyeomyia smithii]
MNYNLQVPVYCEHYEPLLVEEIALVEHPTMLHYGKCAVIGYLKRSSDMLDSLMIPSLPNDLQLPDGTSQLQLLFENYHGPVYSNSTVRVYGCVSLNASPEIAVRSSKDIICYFRQLKTEIDLKQIETPLSECRFQKEWNLASNMYKPVLDVEYYETVQQAKEVISCNLRLKRINKHLELVTQNS